MTFDEALSSLNELVGSEVVVSVAGADEFPPVCFVWTGILRAGSRDKFAEWIYGARWRSDSAVTYFGLDDSHGRGFYIARTDFRAARYEPGDGHDVLAIELGNATLRVRAS
jgi:hypothetical protein